MFRTKYGYGAPENENTPHFREIPSVAPEVFHYVRVGEADHYFEHMRTPGRLFKLQLPTLTLSSAAAFLLVLVRVSRDHLYYTFILSFKGDNFATFLLSSILSVLFLFLLSKVLFSFISRSDVE